MSDGANTISETYALDLANIDESPALAFAGLPVVEGSGGGTIVGNLSASDPEGKALSYTLLGSSADLYDLVMDFNGGYKVVVKNGVVLDYENPAHRIFSVSVSDDTHTATGIYNLNLTDTIDILIGTRRNDTLRGQSGADSIKGLAGHDKLYGNSGGDTLWGGAGNDTLTGGSGRDIFVFDTRLNKNTNKDKVTDFQVADDAFWLDNAIFSKLGRSGSEAHPSQMKSSYFTIGTKATKKNHHIIYDKKGVVYYDADGSGSEYKQVAFATVAKNLKMTYKDFFVI